MKKQISILILVFVLLTTCKKDSEIKNSNESCTEIPNAPVGLGYQYILDTLKPSYEAPYYNPNNPDEIVFLINDFKKEKFGLYYLNLVTKEKKILYDRRVHFQPKWGKNGWILFCGNNKQAWKVKPNGDSLTQLTFDGENYSPEWNKDGTLFLTNNYKGKYYLAIYKPSGEKISELVDCFVGSVCWQHDSLICESSTPGLAYATISNCKGFRLKSYNDIFGIGNAIWIANHLILYSANGLHYFDILNKSEKKIKNGCNSSYYVFISYSTVSNKIIANKVERKLVNANIIYVKSYLVTMNADGSDEQELIIP